MENKNQLAILYVYSLYSSEKQFQYLQYTAALVLFYYLTKKGHFEDYKETQLLVYDYKDSRRFMWEDKTFMNDINVIRGFDYLSRARVKTSEYRDINAHQCTQKGADFINHSDYITSVKAKEIINELSCKCGDLLQVQLDNDHPRLVCKSCDTELVINGFLSDLFSEIESDFVPEFL